MSCSLRKEDFFPLLDTNHIIHDQGHCLTVNCPFGLIGSHPAKDSVGSIHKLLLLLSNSYHMMIDDTYNIDNNTND